MWAVDRKHEINFEWPYLAQNLASNSLQKPLNRHLLVTTVSLIILLLTQSGLSIAQARSSFQCLSMCYASPILTTEALSLAQLVTYVQLL